MLTRRRLLLLLPGALWCTTSAGCGTRLLRSARGGLFRGCVLPCSRGHRQCVRAGCALELCHLLLEGTQHVIIQSLRLFAAIVRHNGVYHVRIRKRSVICGSALKIYLRLCLLCRRPAGIKSATFVGSMHERTDVNVRAGALWGEGL